MIIVLSVFQYVGGLEEYYPRVEGLLFGNLREATGTDVSKFMRSALASVDFGALGISGFIFLIWTSLGLVRNIDYAFHRIWRVKIESSVYKRLLMHWFILIAVPVAIIMFITAKTIFFMHQGRRSIEYQSTFALFLWAFLFVLYKFIPEVRVKSWIAVFSAAVSGVSLFVLQKTFLLISSNLFRQNKIYGSLASFPIFLIWLLAVWYVVLLGVSLCAFLQQKAPKSS
jgi:membrane protein